MYIGLDSDRFYATGRNHNFNLTYPRKYVVNVHMSMRNGSVLGHMDAYRCVTDAFESIQMHTDASGCIPGTRY